ncbi:MAG: Maf family protein [Flavobacteriales bacterium]|nr:Maf family protein [Flavobacteriales bacterium]
MNKIILGSKSPRRKQLMEGLEIPFTVMTCDTDETLHEDFPVRDAALHLAERKMDDLLTICPPDSVIITADTTVILHEMLLNKPENDADAVRMLGLLSGNMHEVITGVCITAGDKRISFFDVTKVYFRHLSEETIRTYVQKHQPFDKAGSYGIQDKIGYVGIERIEGCFYNVMGLPVRKVYENLAILMESI